MGSPAGSVVKNHPAMQKMQVASLGPESKELYMIEATEHTCTHFPICIFYLNLIGLLR